MEFSNKKKGICMVCGNTNQELFQNLAICSLCWSPSEKFCSLEAPEIDKITEHIYLGNVAAQKQKALLKILKITHILVVGLELEIFHSNDFVYKKLEIDDSFFEGIKNYFEETYKFIEEANGNVFVHCMWGISRSPTIVIAYLMRKEKKGFEEIFSFVKSKRKWANPNDGFKEQLMELEEKLKQ